MTNDQMKELLILASERLTEQQYSLFLSALAQRTYADQEGDLWDRGVIDE